MLDTAYCLRVRLLQLAACLFCRFFLILRQSVADEPEEKHRYQLFSLPEGLLPVISRLSGRGTRTT